MAVLRITQYPEPVLLHPTELVENFTDPDLQKLIDDMIETMYDANGAGLAATQVGVERQIAVIDISEQRANPLVLVVINPKIITLSGQRRVEEGCLSIQNFSETVPRASHVRVQFQDRQGNAQEMDATDHLAHVFQHEIDHLNGKLFIHHLSPVKKHFFEKKYKKSIKKYE